MKWAVIVEQVKGWVAEIERLTNQTGKLAEIACWSPGNLSVETWILGSIELTILVGAQKIQDVARTPKGFFFEEIFTRC